MKMKILHPFAPRLKANLWLALLLTLFAVRQAHAQCTVAPNIAYSGVNAVYPTGTAIAPLTPTVTGGTPMASGKFYVSVLAGLQNGSSDGTGGSAYFRQPYGTVADNAGKIGRASCRERV